MRTSGFYSVSIALALAYAAPVFAQQTFDSPEAAAEAVIEAAGNHDNARLLAIFGPNAKDVLSSPQAADEQTEFARMAQAKHRVEVSPQNPNRAVLDVGDADWPFPVPLVSKDGKWSFDVSAAPLEMRARQIGTNELDAIEICLGYVDAQRKFASEEREKDGMLQYAPHLITAPGRHDGLYWTGAGEPLVPEAFAHAVLEGNQKGTAKPYHGYYFRVLTAQGPHASGGPHTFLVKGKLIGGFGLVAWPAEYGVTGVHTFIVNQEGVVFEKDIEPAPGQALALPTRFDPDPTWERVE
jgi:hypothetical protein